MRTDTKTPVKQGGATVLMETFGLDDEADYVARWPSCGAHAAGVGVAESRGVSGGGSAILRLLMAVRRSHSRSSSSRSSASCR